MIVMITQRKLYFNLLCGTYFYQVGVLKNYLKDNSAWGC